MSNDNKIFLNSYVEIILVSLHFHERRFKSPDCVFPCVRFSISMGVYEVPLGAVSK